MIDKRWQPSLLGRVSLFSLLGCKVKLDITWLLLGFLIAWTMAVAMFPSNYNNLSLYAYWGMGITSAIGVLASIVFHEYAHAMIAHYYGLPTKSITLFIFGGVPELEPAPVNPRTELLIAFCGPCASLFLALVFYTLQLLARISHLPVEIVSVPRFLAYFNLFLAVFNMIPAFPLDGGRILRAVLWWRHGNLHSATRIAGRIGSVFGLIMMILGVVSFFHRNFVTGMWWFLVGAFLRSAAGSSYRQLLINEIVSGNPVRLFMQRNPIILPAFMNIHKVIEKYSSQKTKALPVVQDGNFIGCLNIDDIKNLPEIDLDNKQVFHFVRECPSSINVSPNTDTASILYDMARRHADTPYMVVEQGRLVGIISLTAMREVISQQLDGH